MFVLRGSLVVFFFFAFNFYKFFLFLYFFVCVFVFVFELVISVSALCSNRFLLCRCMVCVCMFICSINVATFFVYMYVCMVLVSCLNGIFTYALLQYVATSLRFLFCTFCLHNICFRNFEMFNILLFLFFITENV